MVRLTIGQPGDLLVSLNLANTVREKIIKNELFAASEEE